MGTARCRRLLLPLGVLVVLPLMAAPALAGRLADLPWDDKIPAAVRSGVSAVMDKENAGFEDQKNEKGKPFIRFSWSVPKVGSEEKVEARVTIQRFLKVLPYLAILGLTAVVSAWVSGAFALGVVAGGALMAANFSVIVAVIRAVIGRGEAAPLKVGLYWVKFAALMMIAGALVLIFKVDGMGILVGLSTILVAIVAEALLRAAGI